MPRKEHTKSTSESGLSFGTADSSPPRHKTSVTTDVAIDNACNSSSVAPQPPKCPVASPDLSWHDQSKEDKAITIVNAKSYKIYTSIGLTKMYSQPVLLDTGCGPCLITRSTIRLEWLLRERSLPPTRYTGATGTPVRITGLLDLDLQIGDLRKSITLAIVDHLAVPLIFTTAYKEKYIESIHCRTRRLRPPYRRSVATLTRSTLNYAP